MKRINQLLFLLTITIFVVIIMAGCGKQEIPTPCTQYSFIKDRLKDNGTKDYQISKVDYWACNDADRVKFESAEPQLNKFCGDDPHFELWYYVKN